jgi:protein TonB
VFVAFRVQVNGTATNCRVDRSSGNPAIDAETCRLVQTQLRFRPAMNRRGEPVVAWYGYIQAEVGR